MPQYPQKYRLKLVHRQSESQFTKQISQWGHLLASILIATFIMPATGKSTDSLKKLTEIQFPSKADSTKQPATIYIPPKTDKPAPLLVVLHTWSENGNGFHLNKHRVHEWCIKHRWAMIAPLFRGANSRPQACGSELVVKDIVSAVEYMKKVTSVDADRIYLLGTSGGGHAALLMAGRAPKLWAGVSAWVPISDLAAWHQQSRKSKYAKMIEQSCGGAPGSSLKVDQQYKSRSPITHLHQATDVWLDINAGIHDGHKGSVPISHSLDAFNILASKSNRISSKDIESMTRNAKVPDHLKATELADATYGKKKPLFRRQSGKARITLFDGGHELVPKAALSWLAQQSKSRSK
jgi:poly(3-hydroxybutyrate) depolymerase